MTTSESPFLKKLKSVSQLLNELIIDLRVISDEISRIEHESSQLKILEQGINRKISQNIDKEKLLETKLKRIQEERSYIDKKGSKIEL